MDPDGTNVRVLTNNSEADFNPAWSADGTKLSFDSFRGSSTSDVYTMSPDGSGLRRLTMTPGEDFRTSWSPDGRIVFQSGRGPNFDIFTMNGADGSDQRRLTADPSQDSQPAWSPDGAKIAYRSGRVGSLGGADIFTMDPEVGETKDLKNVTNSPVSDFVPHFSPDSRQIAFQATRADGTLAIFRMNADGTGPATFLTTVTDRPSNMRFSSNESNPAWSPDGTRIVFHSDRDRDPSSTDPAVRDNVEVYTMNAADGSDVRRLTNSPGFDGRCDWGRVRPAAVAPPTYDVPRPVTPPVTPPGGRVRPNLLRPGGSASQVGRRVVVRVRGRMRDNRGRSCAGRVKIGVRFARSRRVVSGVRMGANCRYSKRVSFPVRRLPRAVRARRKVLVVRVAVRFQGNAGLLPDVSPTRRIKVRR